MRQILLLFLISAIHTGCNKIESAFTDKSPYEEYVESLKKSELYQTAMVNRWLEEGQHAFSDSLLVELPFTATGSFQPDEPNAIAYSFQLREGQVVKIECRFHTEGDVFLDLFSFKNSWEHIDYADSVGSITYEANEDGVYLLRIQPELLINVYFALAINIDPALVNPVSQAKNSSIGSFFGDPRDAGSRTHEGIDIFAPRGTPVIAPVDGFVSRVGTNRLGGKVVWLRDRKRGHSYYFAHLDSQLVSSGTTAKIGDTLGLVGNSGNAISTPPHLHFGIYSRGSKNPYYFVLQIEDKGIPEINKNLKNQIFKVQSSLANLRAGPGSSEKIVLQLEKNTFLRREAESGDWYHISLPDRKSGFIHKSVVGEAEEGTTRETVKSVYLLSKPDTNAIPLGVLEEAEEVTSIASFNSYSFIKNSRGETGWVELKVLK